MIYVGYSDAAKRDAINAYRSRHDTKHTVVLTPQAFSINPAVLDAEVVDYPDIIRYVYFYRLLQEIGSDSLVVVNECLRTQNRHDLTFNCIRHFLNRTTHRLIFQFLPQIDEAGDFMTLFDFDSGSRWKREPYSPLLVRSASSVDVIDRTPRLLRLDVMTSDATRRRYAAARKRLFASVNGSDPHRIPRQLLLETGTDKLAIYEAGATLGVVAVARNARYAARGVNTYQDALPPGRRCLLIDPPHRFIDMADFITRARPEEVLIPVTDLPVDAWYWRRYHDWTERLHATCHNLS